jgi:hypothetical protein
MLYLIPIPIILIAVIIYLISQNFGLKVFEKITKIIIILGILIFIYLYADHNGYNILNMVMTCVNYLKSLLFE